MSSPAKPTQGKSSLAKPTQGKTSQGKSSRKKATQGTAPRAGDRVKMLAFSAMFAALALIFSYIEALIPILIPVPGVKLGVANLVIIIALYRMGFRRALSINCVRIALAGLLFSGIFGMIYSFAGGILSLIVMQFLKRTGLFSMVGVSMAGGAFHNLGQLIAACIVVSTPSLMSYFSVLLLTGLIGGILIGILAYAVERRLPADIC